MKTVGTLLPSVQTHHSHQHELQLYICMKQRTDSTTCQASLVVMEVLKREYTGTLSVLNLRLLAVYCIRFIRGRCHPIATKGCRYDHIQNLLAALDTNVLTAVHTSVYCATVLCRFPLYLMFIKNFGSQQVKGSFDIPYLFSDQRVCRAHTQSAHSCYPIKPDKQHHYVPCWSQAKFLL